MELMEKGCVVIDKLTHDESGGRGDCLTHASIVPSPVPPVGGDPERRLGGVIDSVGRDPVAMAG